MHPTPKPVALVADALRDCTARGDLVLDPFLGSGTTLIAAERTGRRCRAIELDPLYVDTAVRRWEVFTGKAAVHAEERPELRRAGRMASAGIPSTGRPARQVAVALGAGCQGCGGDVSWLSTRSRRALARLKVGNLQQPARISRGQRPAATTR